MASMAGAPRVRSLNVAAQEAEADARPVLVPGGNKARSGPAAVRKPSPKQPQPQLRKAAEATPEKPQPAVAAAAAAEEQAEAEGTKKAAGGGEGTGGARKGLSSPLRSPRRTPPASRKKQQELAVPLSASCSSEPASVEPLHGRASGGRTERSLPRPVAPKRGKAAAKVAEKDADVLSEVVVVAAPATPEAVVQGKRRCAWVTPTTDPYHVTFHDEEWGVPVHDDRRLFELLVLCGALAELSWPEILKRRQNFREIFMDFDPLAIAKINEKKLIAPGSIATSLLSEQKLRAVLENARQIIKIADEFGSFNQYCWGFLNHKPMVSKFRYPRQVPVKSPKADMISKDMLRRGFRGVGPTVVYSFMQAAGLTNDHHVSCFRFKECNAPPTPRTSDADGVKTDSDLKTDELRTKNCSEEMNANAALSRAIDALTISQDHEEQ